MQYFAPIRVKATKKKFKLKSESCAVAVQVNETLIRSIVTQPPELNYVYADDYDTLELVRNLVLTKACRVLVTAAPTTTTRSLPSPSSPSTTTTPTISTTVNRLGDRTLPTFDGTSVVFYAHDVQL